MIIAYTTVADKETATKIAKELLEKKLIACANYFPITSLYMWEGEMCNDGEYTLLLKTSKDKYTDLEKEISKIHPYDIPCILKLEVTASAPFDNWLNQQLI